MLCHARVRPRLLPRRDLRFATGAGFASAVTVAEHVYGLARRPEARTLARLVHLFLEVAQVLPWDRDAAQRQGELRARLEGDGTPIHAYDAMIAAHALSRQLILVTDNEKHFRRVPRLHVENWLRSDA